MLPRMLPAPPVRQRPPGPDDRILHLRISWIRAHAAWAGGYATRSDGEPTELKESRRGLIGRPEGRPRPERRFDPHQRFALPMERMGFEPTTPWLQTRCSPS